MLTKHTQKKGSTKIKEQGPKEAVEMRGMAKPRCTDYLQLHHALVAAIQSSELGRRSADS